MSFLRNPSKRAISIIAHHHRNKRLSAIGRFFQGSPKYTAYLDSGEFVSRHIANYQTKVFSLGGMQDVNQPTTINGSDFIKAKKRLNSMDFIGLTEEFHESVRLFESLTGVKLAKEQSLNKSKKYDVPDEVLERIKKLNQYDEELYQIAREKFDSLKAMYARYLSSPDGL